MGRRWEPEPGEMGFTRRPSKWDSQETDFSADAYQNNADRDTGLLQLLLCPSIGGTGRDACNVGIRL